MRIARQWAGLDSNGFIDGALDFDVYDDNNKLRFAETGSDSVEFQYDPRGNRVYKAVSESETITQEIRYVVDIVGRLPVILCEVDVTDPGDCSLKNRYYYTNSQILAQDSHNDPNYANFDRYFYLHDRLGSVRQLLDETGQVVNSYTYQPFGDMFVSDANETVYNPFKFTGQWYDDETGQYYLRARQYDPFILRFTSRDPVKGKFREPLTLHRYLYCANDPINRIDLDGRWAFVLSGSISGVSSGWLLGGASRSSMADLIKGGLGMHVLMRQALIGLAALEADLGIGGTAGAGIVAGQDKDGHGFFGSIFYAAAGGAASNGGGVSATLDIGFSPNAQRLQDLAGGFTEVGGSVTVPSFVASIFTGFSVGVTYGIGDNGTGLFTLSLGAGTNVGGVSWEGHIYRGGATVVEW